MEESVKSKAISKIKDRRQIYSQDGAPKKTNKHQGLMKSDSHLSPLKPFESSFSMKKLFNEANKLVKIGVEKDQELLERDNTLQSSSETIDNLRKNMLHLQMEYEKLDQNFQREISCRSEVVKRIDATRELVDSATQCSNILAASLKQLEDDKLKIAEYYEMIYQNQKEVEIKHAEIEKFLKAQDELVNAKLGEIKKTHDTNSSQHAESVSQLSKKLAYLTDKLKIATDENEKLKQKVQEFKESASKLEAFLEQQERLNNLHQENVVSFKQSLKKLKTQRFKYQKLLKNKKKELVAVFSRNKNLKKTLEKTEISHSRNLFLIKDLESKNNELKTRFEKHLEEDARERQSWETEKQDLISQLNMKNIEMENLKTENKYLSDKNSELVTNASEKRSELEQIQNDLSKMLSENLQLKEDVTKLNEESKDKAKMISELEIKNNVVDADLNSQIVFYKNETAKLQEVVKALKNQLSEAQKKFASEKAEKESVIFEFNTKLEENLKKSYQKINHLEKLLQSQTSVIQNLESEKNHTALESQTALEKLHNELQMEKCNNTEINNNLQTIKKSYENVNKQLEEAKKQISDYEKNFGELNLLNSKLNQTQSELEKNASVLKKEIEFEKKSFEDLKQKHRMVETQLIAMQKTAEENLALKTSNIELKKILDTTEARLEAYKVVVKKLESETAESKLTHSKEISKLKVELTRLEEAQKKKNKTRMGTPQKNTEITLNKKESDSTNTKPNESLFSQKINSKENEIGTEDVEKWHQASTPPVDTSKKFLSTPRNVYTSTPQKSFRSLTPLQKKRDPYEFDSDSSVEHIDSLATQVKFKPSFIIGKHVFKHPKARQNTESFQSKEKRNKQKNESK